MGFNPGGGGSGSISGSSDVALSNVADSQVLSYDSASSKWVNASPPTGGTATPPGMVFFDSYFSGANDSAKMTSMNTWAQAQSGPTDAVLFDARQYDFNVPIKLFSGLKLVGATLSPAREFSRATILNWQGGSGTSMFIFPPEGQTGQTYPSDGSPRDITISYIQLQGGSSTHCMPKYDPTTSSSYAGHTLWYCRFHDCGFKNFSTVWWGWGDGTVIDGLTHFQSIGDTALCLGGSENTIFGNDTYSFMANSTDTAGPLVRSIMSKSSIGRCMITARKTSYGLSIEGGHNLVVDGLALDAQDSDPMYGAGMRISGGDGVTITNCSFKGMATAPSSGLGGASANKGWIHISGGSQLMFSGNNFHRAGNNMPATSFPLAYVTGVGSGQVKWGYNGYSGWGGAGAVLQQSSSGFITEPGDPTLSIVVG